MFPLCCLVTNRRHSSKQMSCMFFWGRNQQVDNSEFSSTVTYYQFTFLERLLLKLKVRCMGGGVDNEQTIADRQKTEIVVYT